MSALPIRTAVAGIGGFGSVHHLYLHQLEKEGIVKVVAACDPGLDRLGDVMEREAFAQRGIATYRDFDEMMTAHGEALGLVTVAAPIGFHAPMQRACVEQGIPCYLEKPPTLDPEELASMITVDEAAAFKTQVGFNYIYQPERHALKERILAGEFGALLRVVSDATWPRSLGYFSRNNWAGRLFVGDQILLDSCCGNAISHHLQNILFMAGSEGLFNVAQPVEVEAELYRAHPIEGTDTVFARGKFRNGVEFRIANTHASDPSRNGTREWFICEKAQIVIHVGHKIEIRHDDGRLEELPIPQPTVLDNFRLYIDYIRGSAPRPVTLLSDCQGFVDLNALLYLAAGQITTVPPAHYTPEENAQKGVTHWINGVETAIETMVAQGLFPSEQHLPWAGCGGKATPESIPELRTALRAIQSAGQ